MKKRTIQFTVTETEHAVLSLLAESKGIRTVGQYAKMLVFTSANARPPKGIFARICKLTDAGQAADMSIDMAERQWT